MRPMAIKNEVLQSPRLQNASEASPPPPTQPPLERLSDAIQEAIKVVIGTHRKPPRRLKSFLNGTWLGHPLHPVIMDIPITSST
jgi:hypothetical protein